MSEEVLGGEGAGESGEGALVYGWSAYPDEGFVGAFPSKKEALDDAYESVGKHDDIFVQAGQYEEVTKLAPSANTVVSSIIEMIGENAYEDCGEDAAEDWPAVEEEQHKELEEQLDPIIRAWMMKHLKMPAWVPVGTAEKIPAPEPDNG